MLHVPSLSLTHTHLSKNTPGFPETHAKDAEGPLLKGAQGEWSASRSDFDRNLRMLGAWDDSRLRIRPGWFSDTVPAAAQEIESIALLRLDGDLYESTRVVLEALYDKMNNRSGFVYELWTTTAASTARGGRLMSSAPRAASLRPCTRCGSGRAASRRRSGGASCSFHVRPTDLASSEERLMNKLY